MKLKTTLFGNVYQFKDVKEVLAKANELRSGDVLAGVAAASSQERVAAKQVLSEMTVADIRNNPVIAYEDDCVTRLIQDDVNETAYNQIKNWSISEHCLYPQRADLGSGGGGSEDLLQRGPDLRREENAGDQKGQYHHRYSGHL